MKHLSIVLLTLLVLASSAHAQQPAATAATAAEPTYKTHKLTRAEFDRLIADPDRLVLIDVRRPDEVASVGGFPVYLSIPVGEVEQLLAWIPRDRTIVTVSNHANRSGRVADVLAAKGFNVAGTIGAQNYEEEGGTLVRTAPTAAAPSR